MRARIVEGAFKRHDIYFQTIGESVIIVGKFGEFMSKIKFVNPQIGYRIKNAYLKDHIEVEIPMDYDTIIPNHLLKLVPLSNLLDKVLKDDT